MIPRMTMMMMMMIIIIIIIIIQVLGPPPDLEGILLYFGLPRSCL